MNIKEMFQAKTIIMAIATGLFACGFSACSSDDDGDGGGIGSSDLEAPAYSDASAKYSLSNDNIRSIEFTESGNYIIIKDYYSYAPARTKASTDVTIQNLKSFIKSGQKSNAQTRASENNGVIYGKYTKINDTTYSLEGFGTVTIVGSTDNAVTLRISENGKAARTVGAQQEEQTQEDKYTKWLCRTWDFKKINGKLTFMGKVRLDKTVKAENYNDLLKAFKDTLEDIAKEYGAGSSEDDYEDDEYYEEEIPEQVIFTKAGSYVVKYINGTLAISTWAWEDKEEGVFRYSWDYEDLYNPDASGTCNVHFSGKSMSIKSVLAEAFNEGTGKSMMKYEETYYLEEAE